MFKRFFQAALITFLLNLAASLSSPEANQPTSVSALPETAAPRISVSWR